MLPRRVTPGPAATRGRSTHGGLWQRGFDSRRPLEAKMELMLRLLPTPWSWVCRLPTPPPGVFPFVCGSKGASGTTDKPARPAGAENGSASLPRSPAPTPAFAGLDFLTRAGVVGAAGLEPSARQLALLRRPRWPAGRRADARRARVACSHGSKACFPGSKLDAATSE